MRREGDQGGAEHGACTAPGGGHTRRLSGQLASVVSAFENKGDRNLKQKIYCNLDSFFQLILSYKSFQTYRKKCLYRKIEKIT